MGNIVAQLAISKTVGDDGCGIGGRLTQFNMAAQYSVLNLVGMGGIAESIMPTPLDKIQSQIQDLQSETQQYINQGALQSIKLQGSIDDSIIEEIGTMQSVLEEEVSYHDEILREKISTNTYYIMYLFILVIIIFIALMFVKFD